MQWKCSVCGKKWLSVYKRPPVSFWSKLPHPKVGAMHSAKLHRVCSRPCVEVIQKHEEETKTVWSDEQ